MAKYDMAWKELFDIDPELSAEGKKVMRALQSRRVWPQKDFLGLMQGVVPGQVDAVKAELEELGYVAERTEHEFVESWPNSRLFAKHDDTDLETYDCVYPFLRNGIYYLLDLDEVFTCQGVRMGCIRHLLFPGCCSLWGTGNRWHIRCRNGFIPYTVSNSQFCFTDGDCVECHHGIPSNFSSKCGLRYSSFNRNKGKQG